MLLEVGLLPEQGEEKAKYHLVGDLAVRQDQAVDPAGLGIPAGHHGAATPGLARGRLGTRGALRGLPAAHGEQGGGEGQGSEGGCSTHGSAAMVPEGGWKEKGARASMPGLRFNRKAR